MRPQSMLERIRFTRLRKFSDLAGWRNFYFDLISFLSLILIPVALAVNLPVYLEQHRYEVIACDTGLIFFLILNFFIRKPVFRGIIFFIYLTGIVTIFFISLGPFYARPGWLVLGSVTAALLFGISGAVATTGFNAVMLILMYNLWGPGLSEWAPVYLVPESVWYTFVMNISCISLVASLPASMLLTRLNLSFNQELDLQKKLSIEREFLESANQSLQKEIIERVQAETALSESRNYLEKIIDSVADPIFVKDAGHRWVLVNEAMSIFMGYPREELLGRTDHDFLPEREADIFREKDDLVFQSGAENVNEEEFTGVHGMVHTIVTKKTRYLDEKGQKFIVGIIRDITGRKQAEQALKESERRFRALAEHSVDAIMRFDRRHRHLYVNPVAESETGISPEEFIGKTHRDLGFPEDLCILWEEAMEKVFQTGQAQQVEFLLPSGLWIDWRLAPETDSRGRVAAVITFSRDITKRKKAEEERRKLEDQLVQAQKMESIGTLAGGIAHDFNNILSSVLGFAGLAELKLERGLSIGEELKGVIDAGVRARDLVRQILTFSRQTGIQRHPLDVSPLIKETMKFLRASLPTTIEIRQDFETSPPCMVMADPTQVHQIIMNLCTNAAQAMKEKGGVLKVGLKRIEPTDGQEIDLKRLSGGMYVHLSVSDTGKGISREIMGRIFDPFFTTKERGEGTGMGLSVVHGIVKEMGGDIFVRSEPGTGSRFDVFMPAHAGETGTSALGHAAARKGTGRILFVDDEEGVLASGYGILKQLGYDIVTTSSPREALDMFKSGQDRFDLVLTDMTMPGMTGIQLSNLIHGIRPDMPVILCTGYSEGLQEDTIRELGIREMVMKPMIAGELAEAVFKALAPVGR